MTPDEKDQKAGRELARQAEKRGIRPKRLGAKFRRPTATPKSKKASARKTPPKKVAAKKVAPRTADNPPSPLMAGFEAWRAETTRFADAYFESGRRATVVAIELTRRNVEFQSSLVQAGLDAAKGLRH